MSHALLSPSGASRWLECTPSARLEADVPDRAGDAASEGTLAHKLSEVMIARELKLISEVKYKEAIKAIEKNKFYSDQMWEHCEDYKAYVIQVFGEAQKITKDAIIHLEEFIDLTMYVPEGFGTGDVIIVADHTIDFIDLKYGKGVQVDATNNKQLMLYALGIYEKYSCLYDIQVLRLTIYQPRIDNFSTWSIEASTLVQWAEEELKPRAQLAWEGKGEFNPGKHCQFCKVKATCKANADHQMQLAFYAFEEPKLLTPEDVSDILSKVASFKNWIKAVEHHALYEAVQNNAEWPGFKVVEGKSNRVITDQEKVIKILNKDYDTSHFMTPPKLLGIGALEKNIGKKELAGIIGDYIHKPDGAPTLVPIEDKRPPYDKASAAANAFDDGETDF